MLKIRCRQCREIIAQINPERLSMPLAPDMFRSTEPNHLAFGTVIDIHDVRCPWGPMDYAAGHNPFYDPSTGKMIIDRLLLDDYTDWPIGETPSETALKRTPQGMRQKEIDEAWASYEAESERNAQTLPIPDSTREISPLNVGKPVYFCRVCGRSHRTRQARWKHEKNICKYNPPK